MPITRRCTTKRKMSLIRKKMKTFRVRELKLICRLDADYFQANKSILGEVKC